MWLRNRGFRYENNLGTSKSSVRAYFLRDRESISDHANRNQRSFALFVVPFVSISTKKVFPLKYEKQNKKKKNKKTVEQQSESRKILIASRKVAKQADAGNRKSCARYSRSSLMRRDAEPTKENLFIFFLSSNSGG